MYDKESGTRTARATVVQEIKSQVFELMTFSHSAVLNVMIYIADLHNK